MKFVAENPLEAFLLLQKEHEKFLQTLSEDDLKLIYECKNRINGMIAEFDMPAIYAITIAFYKIAVEIHKADNGIKSA